MDRLSRSYAISLIYTLVGSDFADWVTQRVEQKNAKVAEEGDKMLDVDPEIAACFRASSHISSK